MRRRWLACAALAPAAGRVSIGDLKRRWGFAPFVAPV
jgi:hypothetical protein